MIRPIPCQLVPLKRLPDISSSILVGTPAFLCVVVPIWYIFVQITEATISPLNSAMNSGGARGVHESNGGVEPSSRTVDGSTSVVFRLYGLGNFTWTVTVGSGLSRWKSLGSNLTCSAIIVGLVVSEAGSCNPISNIERRPNIISTEYLRM